MTPIPETPADLRVRRRATRRLAVQSAALLAALVVILTGAAVGVVLDGQDRAARTQLAAALARADDVDDPPAEMWLALVDDHGVHTSLNAPLGVPDQDTLDATVATGRPSSADRDLGGREVRVDTVRRDDGRVVQAVLDLTANHAERNRLVATMLVAGVLGLALAVGLGAWFASRAVAPLAAALAGQRRFVADAGHELRTPLTLLATRAQLLRRRLRGHDPRAALDAARAEADAVVADSVHLAAILEDLLLSLDLDADQNPAAPVHLEEVVDAVLEAAAAAAAENGVTLRREGPRTQVTVPGSGTALRRAITALVDNAVRHARREVRVGLDPDGRDALVDVRDDGPGVDPALAPDIFARFAGRAALTDTGGEQPAGRRRRPYGLGLALVAEVAAAHAGSVALIPTPDRTGALFRLTLPTDRR